MEVTTSTIDTQSAGTIQGRLLIILGPSLKCGPPPPPPPPPVHFKLQDGGQLVETRMCSAEMSVLEMKEHFARKWEVTNQGMAVSYQGRWNSLL